MADRTSAGLFGSIFNFLSKLESSEDRNKLAKFLWSQCWEYDFSSYQMYCDEALVTLGFAKLDKNSDGDETIVYKDREGKNWEPYD